MEKYMYRLLYTLSLVLIVTMAIHAQSEVLLWEDFNSCELPAGWNVDIEGNQDAVWYIGTPQNPASDGSSIDGTCMVIIDDDATGNNTAPFIWKMTSPAFPGNRYTNLEFSADVHFRDAGETMRILLDTGNDLIELRKFEGRNYSGTQFSEFVKIKIDLSFYQAESLRLIFEYNENAQFAWWAGFDNVKVEGSGNGEILLSENFNGCAIPTGWSSIIETGDNPWVVGKVTNGNAGTNVSMDGSCFLYFDDDGVGEMAAPSRVTMISPVFNGTDFANYTLSFDLIFRTYAQTEYLEIGVLNQGEYRPVHIFTTQIAGNQFDTYEHFQLDLSRFKGLENQIYFKYDDSGEWNWWVGIDNVKLVGEGSINDFCHKAVSLNPDDDCIPFDLEVAFASADIPWSCNTKPTGTLWYTFEQTESGITETQISGASFNDIIEIYKGNNCADLQPIICKDRDEYGFYGEQSTQNLSAGKYYIRVSGKAAEFGKSKGQGCIQILNRGNQTNPPANEVCSAALQIKIGEPCRDGSNLGAVNPEILPSTNNRSRADIWYKFTPESASALKIVSGSDFSDVLTIWKGNCDQLTEVVSNEHGAELLFKDPEAGQTYFIQLSGYFSTLEGHSCIEISETELDTPNDICNTAIILNPNADCEAAFNGGATYSGITPVCDPLAEADMWFSFTAVQSGSIFLKNKSDFVSTVSVYKGDCQQLQSIYCNKTQHTCEGPLQVEGMEAGQTYFIQISSRGKFPGFNRGSSCIEIITPQNLMDWEPLEVNSNAVCVSKNAALIIPQATGGGGDYSFTGNAIDKPIYSLEEYFVEVRDKDGCVDFTRGIAPDCSQMDCNVFYDLQTINIRCHGMDNGIARVVPSGGVSPFEYTWSNNTNAEQADQLAAGNYFVTVSDRGGCEEVLSFEITEPSPLSVEVTDLFDDIYGQGRITITVSGGTAPYRYIWKYGGNQFEDDHTLNNLIPGDYSVRIMDANDCEIMSDIITIRQTTAVHSSDLPGGMQLYPNPAVNELTLAFKANFSGSWKVRISDAKAQTVLTDQVQLQQGGKLSIDISPLVSGMYFIDIIQDDRMYSTKFIKQ